MSVLGTNTLWGGINSFYVPFTTVPANPANIGGTVAPATVAAISTIYTDHLSIDGIGLDGSSAGGGQLLINGVAVATVNQNVSSIANWATYPALSSITYAGGGGSGGLINMATGVFSTLNASAANISSISTSSLVAPVGNFTSISTGTVTALVSNSAVINTSSISASTITSVNGNMFTFATPTANISTLNVSSINGALPVVSLGNWAQLPALSTITYSGGGGRINMLNGSISTLNSAALTASSIVGNTAGLTSGSISTINSFGLTTSSIVATGGSISTLNSAALTVSSINGVAATQSVGAYAVMTTNHSVAADNTLSTPQTLVFTVDNTVPFVAGNWYAVSLVINYAGDTRTTTGTTFVIQLVNNGGSFLGVSSSQTYINTQQIALNQNNVTNVSNAYFFNTIVKATASGFAGLQIISTTPTPNSGFTQTYNCSSYQISPLGGALN